MIDLNEGAFCSLSNDSNFHVFLQGLDQELYDSFKARKILSKSCGENRLIMKELAQRILANNAWSESLIAYLRDKHPHIMKENSSDLDDELYPFFSMRVLTFPRRMIVYGFLADRVKDFIEYRAVKSGDKYYVEYFEKKDRDIAMACPSERWVLSKYTLRSIKNEA